MENALITPHANKTHRKQWLKKATPYLLLLPSFIMIAGFLFYPMATVFYYSFQHYDISAPFYDGFAGLDNYIQIFTKDKLFYSSLINSVKWVVSEVGLQLILGLAFALLLNEKFKFRGVARTVTFLPWAISGVLTSVMWMLMYNEHIGVFNDILMKLGLIKKNISFLSSTNSAFVSVVIAELWRGIPFFAVTLLAGLQNIPEELYEAAKVDGATKWVELTSVTLPQLKNTIVLTTLLRIVWEFNNVDLLYNLTGGGPANTTTTYAMYIANTAVKGSNFGYGSALTVIGFIILTVVALIYLTVSKYNKE